MSNVTIKGSGLKPNFDWIRQTYGDDAWSRVLESLSAEERAQAASLSPALMYPAALLDHVCVALVAQRFPGDRDGAARAFHEMGIHTAEVELTGIYSAFLKLTSPEKTFKRSASLLATLYTGVDAEAQVVDEGGGRKVGTLHVRGLGEVAYASPRLAGFAEYAFGKLRVKDLRVSERSWAAGGIRSDELVFDVSWVE